MNDGGKSHQGDRQNKAEDHHVGMLACGAGDRKHVVQRHRHVRDDDLPGSLGEGLARRLPRCRN